MKNNHLTKRESGILLPIFSLPSRFGIGSLGQCAYDFINFLEKANQRYWQVLPIGPTSYGDSPYQSFSSFAGNPYFIDLDILISKGLLNEEEVAHEIDNSHYIDYAKLYNNRFTTLKLAYNRFVEDNKYLEFCKNNQYWLDDYALFMELKNYHNGVSFREWSDEFKFRNIKAIASFKKQYTKEINFWKFIQYEFYSEWKELKEYANNHNVKLIGDIPIYTALDSSDVWANIDLFMLDQNFDPIVVAGCPADDFSPLGQLWGNPIYNWKKMKLDDYDWWTKRIGFNKELFDVIRIDHFRGFEAYFTIKYGASDGTVGVWEKGPNAHLFETIEKKIGHTNIIAENLGFLTDGVEKMLNRLDYPGMKILEFGFNKYDDSDSSTYNLTPNTVCYPGTHDNAPIRNWYEELSEENKNYLHEYLSFTSPYEAVNEVIKACLSSVCLLSIIPHWDYLQKGRDARINTPSTLGGNWLWRMDEGDMNDDLASYINHLMDIYHRNK